MKSRILFCDYWEDPQVDNLSVEEKIVGLYYWLNSRVNLVALYPMSDAMVAIETGVNVGLVSLAKVKLEKIERAHFYNGWVYLPNAQEKCGYTNQKQEVAVIKELANIPVEVLAHFRSFGYSIPYGYPIDSPLNQKSEIITFNEKDETEWTNKDTEDVINKLEV